jgi:transcriptional regulator with XRE-family HTH domain
MSVDLVQLGQTLRDLRRAAGLTQPELGARLGISAVAVSQVEHGKTAPALAKVAAIADALGVGISLLLGDRLARAEHAIAPVRAELRSLGYDLALIPREDA